MGNNENWLKAKWFVRSLDKPFISYHLNDTNLVPIVDVYPFLSETLQQYRYLQHPSNPWLSLYLLWEYLLVFYCFFHFILTLKHFPFVESNIWNTIETDLTFLPCHITQSKSKHIRSHLPRKCNIKLTSLLQYHIAQHKYTVLIYYQVNEYTTDPLLCIKSAIRTI